MNDNFTPGVHPSREHAYLSEIFDRLESGNPVDQALILARARTLIGLWRQAPETPPFLIETWERLLMTPVATMRQFALANDERGRELRHSMPFAGVLNNFERTALIKAYPKAR